MATYLSDEKGFDTILVPDGGGTKSLPRRANLLIQGADAVDIPTLNATSLTFTGGTAVDPFYFEQEGVHVSRYMAGAGYDICAALSNALLSNPDEIRFILPPHPVAAGGWEATFELTETEGLRSNLVFDGIDANRCRIFHNGFGGIFHWAVSNVYNICFRNVTLDFVNTNASFSQSINVSQVTNCLIEKCRFLNTFSFTSNGTTHAVGLHGGSNIRVINNYFDRTQTGIGGLGTIVDGAIYAGNIVDNCNDLAVSVVSGQSSGMSLKNINIHDNIMRGIYGAGYIYVGDDSSNDVLPDMADVNIHDNICSGTITEQFTPQTSQFRVGIQCVLGENNKRISIRNNTISNDNPTNQSSGAHGIFIFTRNQSSTGTDGLDVSNNQVDFRSTNVAEAIAITGNNISNCKVDGNQIVAGSRGLVCGNMSFAQITNNNVHGASSAGLQFFTDLNSCTQIRIMNNFFEATGDFRPSVLLSGANAITKMAIDHNTLLGTTYSVLNNITPGTVEYKFRYNDVNGPTGGSSGPTVEIGTVT